MRKSILGARCINKKQDMKGKRLIKGKTYKTGSDRTAKTKHIYNAKTNECREMYEDEST